MSSDLAIRYGGEEFVVMLHNASDEGTQEVAKKIHSAFAAIYLLMLELVRQ